MKLFRNSINDFGESFASAAYGTNFSESIFCLLSNHQKAVFVGQRLGDFRLIPFKLLWNKYYMLNLKLCKKNVKAIIIQLLYHLLGKIEEIKVHKSLMEFAKNPKLFLDYFLFLSGVFWQFYPLVHQTSMFKTFWKNFSNTFWQQGCS